MLGRKIRIQKVRRRGRKHLDRRFRKAFLMEWRVDGKGLYILSISLCLSLQKWCYQKTVYFSSLRAWPRSCDLMCQWAVRRWDVNGAWLKGHRTWRLPSHYSFPIQTSQGYPPGWSHTSYIPPNPAWCLWNSWISGFIVFIYNCPKNSTLNNFKSLFYQLFILPSFSSGTPNYI